MESTLWMICCKRNFSAHGDSSTVVVMNIMAVGRRSGTGLCNGCIDLPAGYFTDELRQAGLPLSLSLVFVTVFVCIIVIAFVLVFVIVFVIVFAMVASIRQLIISQISRQGGLPLFQVLGLGLSNSAFLKVTDIIALNLGKKSSNCFQQKSSLSRMRRISHHQTFNLKSFQRGTRTQGFKQLSSSFSEGIPSQYVKMTWSTKGNNPKQKTLMVEE